jgi:hypothetical protein
MKPEGGSGVSDGNTIENAHKSHDDGCENGHDGVDDGQAAGSQPSIVIGHEPIPPARDEHISDDGKDRNQGDL